MSPSAKSKRVRHIEYHRDGSIRAKGWTRDGKLDGSWEWFRLDGTRLRSGSFDRGQQIGTWTTYDQAGVVYKVTHIKPVRPASNRAKIVARRSSPSRRAR